MTHVLLPVVLLGRRADAAAVIWAGLVAAASGLGHRRVAALLGRPSGTVRGWLRRFAARAVQVQRVFTVVGVGLDPDPVPPSPAGSVFADAVAAVLFAARAARCRWGSVLAVSPPRLAASVTAGGLLAPPRSAALGNTSRLWR